MREYDEEKERELAKKNHKIKRERAEALERKREITEYLRERDNEEKKLVEEQAKEKINGKKSSTVEKYGSALDMVKNTDFEALCRIQTAYHLQREYPMVLSSLNNKGSYIHLGVAKQVADKKTMSGDATYECELLFSVQVPKAGQKKQKDLLLELEKIKTLEGNYTNVEGSFTSHQYIPFLTFLNRRKIDAKIDSMLDDYSLAKTKAQKKKIQGEINTWVGYQKVVKHKGYVLYSYASAKVVAVYHKEISVYS
ncbi:hypothetical protein [Listeria phage LMTA-148]|uniref:Uncharacterized protein n=1 Tax=Listeria phage LMTA-148 TaxID=1486413 RepID=A0A068CFM4_9CAUD|nr:hypothetical protein LD12_gp004 [Listeria phage LMTA-148]AID17281.1 hypothetical protein [Listeria phage LMTA-148]